MKKIPTLFKRIYENHKVIGITDEVTEGCEFVLEGKGTPTVKYDGSCCAIIGGQLYKRYDAKKGKKAPEGAIPCQDAPDEITGHFPHWVKCDRNNPADKWLFKACEGTKLTDFIKYPSAIVAFPSILPDGTYEAIGEHFQGNPYHLKGDTLVKHGTMVITAKLNSFEAIKEFLKNNDIEGIVFWLDGEPRCKIKRSDFGFEWGCK